MPAFWSGSGIPSPIVRTNRSGGEVGTSPGINPITPYTTAANDYRATWIAGEMMEKTRGAVANPNISSKLWGETLGNESRAVTNSVQKPVPRTVLPDPPKHTRFVETSGLERSLSTNIPDHPTAIQVNGLRQERTEHVMCPGHIYGVNTYDARTLTGNWAEERCDKAYLPSVGKAPTGSDWQFETTYGAMTTHTQHKVLPDKASNSVTMYMHGTSPFATGVKEESLSSNKEIVKLGGVPGVDYVPGDHRSASRFAGNYVNYQCGKQHLVAQVGGRVSALPPYETTTQAGFSDPAAKRLPTSTERCDVHKPPFMIRDPGRDGKSKMLCGIRSNEFACDALTEHIIGNPIKGKQKTYTLEQYRNDWTRSAPEIVAAGKQDTTEHRTAYLTPDLGALDATFKMPGHIGSWH